MGCVGHNRTVAFYSARRAAWFAIEADQNHGGYDRHRSPRDAVSKLAQISLTLKRQGTRFAKYNQLLRIEEELEQTVTGALAKDWTWARIDRLVRAILLAGAYELVHRKDVPLRVVINEYVEIGHAFYDQGEPTFINSVLDRVAHEARPADFAR